MDVVTLRSSEGIRLLIMQLGGSEPFLSNDEDPSMPREPLWFVGKFVSLVCDFRAVNRLDNFPWGT